MTELPSPPADRGEAEIWVRRYLAGLVLESPSDVRGSASIRGGQSAADRALEQLDIRGYATKRENVLPEHRRGATRLSPYLRHGLLTLSDVWYAVDDGPPEDVHAFREGLLWQEYGRHLYARLGMETRRDLRFSAVARTKSTQEPPVPAEGLFRSTMACLSALDADLLRDGWLVHQTRMWAASQWTIGEGRDWRDGEQRMFQHLLDGARASGRLGWQWTVGTGTGEPYAFSRYQVQQRAPQLCHGCVHASNCPIENWPDPPRPVPLSQIDPKIGLDRDPVATAGPRNVVTVGRPTHVWITAESMGLGDPALVANPSLPALFVFDAVLLRRLQLSAKRMVFLAETLGELARRHPGGLQVRIGQPAEELKLFDVAVTFAPVPGFRRIRAHIQPMELHPWPWLYRPHGAAMTSFSLWRSKLK